MLCVTFGPPTEADDSELNERDIIVRRKNDKLLGLTVLGFSKRKASETLTGS